MPTYLFIHPESEEQKEVFQKINEPHVYIDQKGIEWRRVFTAPNVSVDANTDPFSEKDYSRKTKRKGNLGDLYDQAREASEQRKDKLGHDPVQEKWFKDYSEKRKGKKHPNDPSKPSLPKIEIE